jgi:hypothetical protein
MAYVERQIGISGSSIWHFCGPQSVGEDRFNIPRSPFPTQLGATLDESSSVPRCSLHG